MKKANIVKLLMVCNLFAICQPAYSLANNYEEIQKPQSFIQFTDDENSNFTARKYILGPNDIISIYVYDSPEFNQEKIKIQPDGRIVIAPLGSLKVAGMTIEQLHGLLIQKCRYYLNDPKITIKLDQTKPFVLYISGAVKNPGSYELNTNISPEKTTSNEKPEVSIDRKTPLLSNVLVAAGGVLFDADLEHIKIVNSFDKSEIDINLLDLLEKANSSQDVYLMSGDTVYVPELPTPLAVDEEKYKKYARATFSPQEVPVRVFGYVNEPGLVKLVAAQSLTLNSAITAAGGYLKDSAYAPKKVYVSRVDVSGKLNTRVVNPMSTDIVLMPNDIVYVPEKPRPLAGKAFDYTARILSPINAAATTYNNWSLIFDPTRFQPSGK